MTAPPMLADVLATPDDEGLRRVCADWLEDHGDPARADFIRTQLELARLPPSSPRRAELEDREDDLLAEHEERWLGSPPAPLFEWRFRGGFVNEVVLRGPPRLDDCAALFASHPAGRVEFRCDESAFAGLEHSPLLPRVRRFYLNGTVTAEGPVPALLSRPELAGLQGIRLSGNGARDDLLPVLASRPGADRLRELILHSLSSKGLARFLAEPAFAGVTALGLLYLSGTTLKSLFAALLDQPGRWTALDVRTQPVGKRVLSRFAELTALRELSVQWPEPVDDSPVLPAGLERLTILHLPLSPAHLSAFASQPCLPNLRHLELSFYGRRDSVDAFPTEALGEVMARLSGPVLHLGLGNDFSRPLAGLARLPGAENVRSLEVEDTRLADADFKALAQSDRFRSLHTLKLANCGATARRVAWLAGSPALAGLRELDVFGSRLDADAVRSLLRSPGLARLRSLHLGSAGLDASVMPVLLDWPGLSRLRWLGLTFNRLDPASVAPLWRPGVLSPVARLSLSENVRREGRLTRADVPPDAAARFGARLLI